jgi:hypothetical protein
LTRQNDQKTQKNNLKKRQKKSFKKNTFKTQKQPVMSLKIKKAIDPVWKRGVNRVSKNFEFFLYFHIVLMG